METQLEILKNAYKYNGKADSKAVVSSILGQNKELRKEAKELILMVNEILPSVNSLSIEKQKEKIRSRNFRI